MQTDIKTTYKKTRKELAFREKVLETVAATLPVISDVRLLMNNNRFRSSATNARTRYHKRKLNNLAINAPTRLVNSRFRAACEHASLRSKSRRSTTKSALRGRHRLRNETQQMDFKFNRDLASRVKRHRQLSTENRGRSK